MDTFTQAMLLVANIYNSDHGNAFLPDHLNGDGSPQDHLAFAIEQGLVNIHEEYIHLSASGNNLMITLTRPMEHITSKIRDAIHFIRGGITQDADDNTLSQMDRMNHMVSQAVVFNRGNYSNEPK